MLVTLFVTEKVRLKNYHTRDLGKKIHPGFKKKNHTRDLKKRNHTRDLRKKNHTQDLRK